MIRREFIALLGGAASWPLVAARSRHKNPTGFRKPHLCQAGTMPFVSLGDEGCHDRGQGAFRLVRKLDRISWETQRKQSTAR